MYSCAFSVFHVDRPNQIHVSMHLTISTDNKDNIQYHVDRLHNLHVHVLHALKHFNYVHEEMNINRNGTKRRRKASLLGSPGSRSHADICG